jgi:hypothetical protein
MGSYHRGGTFKSFMLRRRLQIATDQYIWLQSMIKYYFSHQAILLTMSQACQTQPPMPKFAE